MSMTIEEAIKYFTGATEDKSVLSVARTMDSPNVLDMVTKVYEANELALVALREKAERDNPAPLTIEELVQMDGIPVWIKDKHSSGYEFSEDAADYLEGRNLKEYGKIWVAYRNMGVGTLKEIREKVEYVKTMTNADRIRAMSDEQLAELLAGMFEDQRVGIEYSDDAGCWLHWLKQPAEEVHHENQN